VKIAVDIRISTLFARTGIPNYVKNLVESLSKIDRDNHYILYAFFWKGYKDKLRETFIPKQKNFIFKSRRIPGTLLNILWCRSRIPLERFIGDFDVVHCTENFIPPVKKGRIVTTVHDLISLVHPEFHLSATVKEEKRRLKEMKDRADIIIAVSENTKKDLVNLLHIEQERIRVIYEAPSRIYRKIKDRNLVDGIKKRYNINKDFILYVGMLEPRKNLVRLIKTYKESKTRHKMDYHLVIVGEKGWMYDEIFKTTKSLNLKSDVIFTGYVGEDDLSLLYNGAKLLVYPSLYEGFGLPPLEAMACGTPVVTSNISSLPEVVGDAAVLVNPYDVDSIAEGILKVLVDGKLKDNLVKKGFNRVKLFSWERTASETLKVYEDVR